MNEFTPLPRPRAGAAEAPTPAGEGARPDAPGGTAGDELLAGLVDDFVRRQRLGERPSVDEYARGHPALADEIRDVFPAMLVMERADPGDGTGAGGGGPPEAVGAVVGRYKLLERIGEGGFGVVYMAEQQHPVRRKVALKLIKPGMDTRQVIARFEAERQALALMDHENIARVLDAGATESGRPYFVMELVRGVPVTEHCDRGRLGPRERLALFLPVCRAVQHAHTKGIIHRDIKPTNVLVTLHDGVPVPKVIDFGIAKAMGQQLTERTLFTNFAQMVGTPLYMSPEQAEMSGLDVDTRSDVYALGVLLYELLTGTTPFDGDRLRRATLDEVRRIIRDEEPPAPSTRISTLGDALAAVSARCNTDGARLRQLVRGELDWVVMRAMEKDRTRRYETANALARDVERYLNDEPVDACPPSYTYRLGKFARRHRAGMAAAAAGLACLVVLAVSLTCALLESRGAARVRDEQRQTVAALGEAERYRALAQRSNAVLAMERGLNSCEQGDLAHGLLWLGRGLELAPGADAADLQHAIRANISAWRARLGYRLRGVLEHDGPVQAVAFSPDGATALTAANDQTARLWDPATGGPIGGPLRHAGKDVRAASFSPDGKLILTGANELATLWDATTRQPVGEPLAHPRPISAAGFSPDGARIVTAMVGGQAYVWDAATRRRSGQVHEVITDYLSFRPDGGAFVTGAFSRAVWDLATLRPASRNASADRATAAAYRRDGRAVVLGFEDGRVVEWHPASDAASRLPIRHEGRVAGIGYVPGRAVIWTAGGEGTVRFWDAATHEPAGSAIRHQTTVYAVAVTPDGRTALTGSGDGRARLWDLLPAAAPPRPAQPQNVLIGLAFAPDGRTLATTSSSGVAQLWGVDTGSELGFRLRHKGPVYGAAFSPDGRSLLTACGDGTARTWRVEGPRLFGLGAAATPLPTTFKHEGAVMAAAYSPDGRRVLTASKDNTARLWDAATGSPLAEPMRHPAWVHAAAFSPDGARVLTGCEDGAARVWDAATGRPLGEALSHRGPVRAVAWAPDGKAVLTGVWGDATAWVWDLAGRRPLAPPLLHREHVVAVAYHPGGRLVATASFDGTARLWDAATGRPVGPPMVMAKNLSLRAIAFAPDGRSLVAGANRAPGTQRWDVPAPAEGSVRDVVDAIRVETGIELDENGQFRMLDAPRWDELRRRVVP